MFTRRAPALDHDTQCIRWADRGVWDIWRDEEGFPFSDEIIDDPFTFADPDLDIAFQLIKIFFRIDAVKVVSCVRSLDDHDKEIPAVVEVAVAYRRFEEMAILFDPLI